MPYSGPTSTSPRIRNHRRSHSFSDDKRSGPFVSLPRQVAPKKPPTFHFKDDANDSPEDDLHQHRPPLSIETQNLSLSHEERALSNGQSTPLKGEPTSTGTVLFPKSSPLSPTLEDTPQFPASTSPRRPTLSRGSSDPILLSNGKPLKSLLKSRSPSASSTSSDVRPMHLRVQSAPTTSFLSKNVRFPEKKEDGLESVRVFRLKAKPASLSQGGDDTETETETEPSQFLIPERGANSSGLSRSAPLFVIDNWTPGATSTIPVGNPPPDANIHFESAAFVQPEAPSAPHLTGTILVRNIAYEKQVAVRFTLDEWYTTIEVRARYVVSVPVLPWEKTYSSGSLGDVVGMIANASNAALTPLPWDRFSFDICLEDYAYKLQERVLWFVGRYTATGEGGGEWWDNNSGSNYRVGFKMALGTSRDRTGRRFSAPGRYLTAPQPTIGYAPTTSLPSYSRTPPSTSSAPQAQSKLSLNYAAPSHRGQLATSSFVEPRSNGTLQQWPWDPSSNSDSDSPSGFGTESESNSPPLRDSPRDMTLLATPFDSNSSSPQLESGTSSPKNILDTDSYQLYNTFVKKWCFAQSPRPGPG
jgi:hypothetical protein